jgi:amidophosphoribosyltransferase
VVISSETAGLDAVGAVHVRDVAPGELLVLDGAGVTSSRVGSAPSAAQCVFELVYFSRPDSVVFGEAVAPARIGFGRRLAEEAPADADLVVPVPDSGTYAALGFAQQSGLPYEPAILRSHAVRRTFIEPTTTARRAAIALKYAPIRALLAGRRVVLVDDSIVRGSTCRQLVAQLRAAGAREVHLRIASPPTIGPCHYGVDTPDPSDLFATGRSIDDMAADLGADSLAHLSLDGLFATLRSVRATYCAGCYSGVYPIHAAAAAPVAVTVPMQRLRRRSA